MREIEDRIRDTPARTLKGLAVKARVIESLEGGRVDEEARALVANILALAGEAEVLS